MKYVISFLFLALCLGCASTSSHQFTTKDIIVPSLIKQNWTSYGVLNITSPKGTLTLNFEWKRTQHGKKTYASFSKMMGMLSSQIEFTEDMVRVHFVNGDVETMINDPKVVGLVLKKKFYIPLNELNYWLIGKKAVDNLHSIVRNNDGTINTLKQAGWTITFDDYMLKQGYFIPKLLLLYNYEEKIRIKIIVHGIHIENI